MREAVGRREQSPPRGGIFGEPRAQSAFHERTGLDARGREAFASPGAQFQRESPHSFALSGRTSKSRDKFRTGRSYWADQAVSR